MDTPECHPEAAKHQGSVRPWKYRETIVGLAPGPPNTISSPPDMPKGPARSYASGVSWGRAFCANAQRVKGLQLFTNRGGPTGESNEES